MRPYSPGRFRASSRQGFTITELLIAATISLILTYAVVQMFDYVASEARYGRASIELASQLRNASRRIGTDLACATAPVRPFADRHGQGYFEYVEGPLTDARTSAFDVDGTGQPQTDPVASSVGGDIDDIVMFTAFNPDEPFRGRLTTYPLGTLASKTTKTIESKYAEIAIWTVRDPSNGRVTLHRRALLIRPDFSSDDFYRTQYGNGLKQFLQENDISVRFDAQGNGGVGALVGNTLGDLSRRENRFAHFRTAFPYSIDIVGLQTPTGGWRLVDDATAGKTNYLEGNDVLLAEVLAFDVRAFDPEAYVRFDTNHFHLNPSDAGYYQDYSHPALAGYPAPSGMRQVKTGAFVDLGFAETSGAAAGLRAPSSYFSGNPQAKSQLVPPAPPNPVAGYRTYCTWSLFYEMNAQDSDNNGTITVIEGDENGDGIPDGGNNQIDDNSNGVVDELAEWDTAPPYPYPMRGVQVTLRVMEPNSRQVRQMSVVQNFTGE